MKTTKKIITVAIIMIMVLSLCAPALAADGNVSYVGGADAFIFAPGSDYSPTDLFDNFKNVMPGDSRTQQIVIKNDAGKKVRAAVYMRSLGAQEETDEFLKQMTLTVKKSGGDDNLFEAPANETAQLTDWVYLGTVRRGGTITLDVTLNVDPEMGNDFQEAIGYLDWQFKVVEKPDRPPKTGDESHLWLWIVLMIVSAAAIVTLIAVKKKKNKN